MVLIHRIRGFVEIPLSRSVASGDSDRCRLGISKPCFSLVTKRFIIHLFLPFRSQPSETLDELSALLCMNGIGPPASSERDIAEGIL